MHNITNNLIKEVSAEEADSCYVDPSCDVAQDSAANVERDNTVIIVLDRVNFYYYIVYSIDYYNHCDYPNVDKIPYRCGILHPREPPPTNTNVTC